MERHSEHRRDHGADRVSRPGLKLLPTHWASHVGFERLRPLTSVSLWLLLRLDSLCGAVILYCRCGIMKS